MCRHTESAISTAAARENSHVRWHPTVRRRGRRRATTAASRRGGASCRARRPGGGGGGPSPRAWPRTRLHALRDGPPSRVASVVVVGAMGSGRCTRVASRGPGAGRTHERLTGGTARSYAHALLYLDPATTRSGPALFEYSEARVAPPTVFVDARGECGEERDHRGAAAGGAMKRIAQCWRRRARRRRGGGAARRQGDVPHPTGAEARRFGQAPAAHRRVPRCQALRRRGARRERDAFG